MVDWYLNTALTGFRNAVNAAYPYRDKGSDGTIGDSAHSSRTSDHNADPDGSVDAWDMDVEVNGRGKPAKADVEALKAVFEAHPSSAYWIHNDQISFRSEGWKRRSYSYAGPDRNRHTQHVHWNTRSSHEGSTAPWIIITPEDEMLTPLQDQKLSDTHFTTTSAINNPTGAAGSVPLHVWAEWVTGTLKAMADSIAAGDDALAAKLDSIDAEADARAEAETQRDAELKALIEAFQAGDLTADEVVDALVARLSN